MEACNEACDARYRSRHGGTLAYRGAARRGASSGGSAPSTDGIGPITFAIGKDNPGWPQDVITGWNEQHPSQKVTLLLLPEASNDQLAQLVANLQAKSDEYDVIDMDVIWTAEFASNGWIIPLPQSQFPLGDFLKPAVDTAMYQGRLYAVPDYSNADLLYYRKDILAKAGTAAAQDLGSAAAARRDRSAEIRSVRVRGHVRPVRRASPSTSPRPSSRPGGRSSPRRAPRSPWTRPGAPGARVPGERVPAGLDPQGRRSPTRRSRPRTPSRPASSCSWITGPTSTPRCPRLDRSNKVYGKFGDRRAARPGRHRVPARSAGPTSRSAPTPSTSRRRWTSSST